MREHIVPIFAERTGATVEFDTGAGADRLSKVMTQGENSGIGVMINTPELSLHAQREGLITPLDTDRLTNYADIPDWAKPFEWGVAEGITGFGLGFNPTATEPVLAWSDLWREDLAGQLSLPAIVNSTMPQFLITIAELNGGSQDDIMPGIDALAELKPAMTHTFWTDYAPLWSTGEVTAAVMFDHYAATMQESPEYEIEFNVPEDGKLLPSLRLMSVVKGGDSGLAHEFINAALEPKAQEGMAAAEFQGATNLKVELPEVAAKYLPSPSEVPEVYRFFDDEFIADHRREWTELMNEHLVGGWQ